jgi:hypothetical protein
MMILGFEVWDFGFGVLELRFGVWRCSVEGLGVRIDEIRVCPSGLGVDGSGYRVLGECITEIHLEDRIDPIRFIDSGTCNRGFMNSGEENAAAGFSASAALVSPLPPALE